MVFAVGFLAATYIGILKLYKLSQGLKAILITDNPWFYIALIAMIIGTQLFLAGFLGELLVKAKNNEKHYTVKEKLNF
jgi:hypothetical protein